MKDKIHIGKLIKKKMKAKRYTAIWLAKELSCSRQNVYKIFDKDNIDIMQLLKISKVLNYDFFNEISIFFNKNSKQ